MLERSCGPVRLEAEPKPGGIRWLARLDPATADAYSASVLPLVAAIEQALPAAVVANRVTRTHPDPPTICLEPWRAARGRFRRQVRAHAVGAGAALMTDVRDCYGSIGVPIVAEALAALTVPSQAVARVLEVLDRLAAWGVRGLPVGPEASAVLANAVLLGVDRRLAAAGWQHVRWVDDLIVFAEDVTEARAVLEVVGEALAELGLALAERKTRVVVDPAVIRGGGPTPPSGPSPRVTRGVR